MPSEGVDGLLCGGSFRLFSLLLGFQAHLSCNCTLLLEDQAVEVVDQVGQRQFGLRPGKADGADEEPVAVFLVRKDMLNPGPHG